MTDGSVNQKPKSWRQHIEEICESISLNAEHIFLFIDASDEGNVQVYGNVVLKSGTPVRLPVWLDEEVEIMYQRKRLNHERLRQDLQRWFKGLSDLWLSGLEPPYYTSIHWQRGSDPEWREHFEKDPNRPDPRDTKLRCPRNKDEWERQVARVLWRTETV